MADEKKFRLQLDITQDALERLDDMKTRLDAATRAEVVRRALRLLDLATSRSGSVVFREEDGSERLLDVV